jgi:hypothetical protein
MGSKHIRMYLRRGGDALVGIFYDTAAWRPVLLGGQWRAENEIALQATAGDGHQLGHLSAN